MFPRSWWWTNDTELWSAILHVLQGANWQRGGGKGAKPKRMKRPKDGPIEVHSAEELAEKKRDLSDELARRRAAKKRREAKKRKAVS